MIVLGLKCYSHDTGAAIISDQNGSLKISAIAESRLNRRKHSFAYPLMSIDYCLSSIGIDNLADVDLICIDKHMEKWPQKRSQYSRENVVKRYQPRYDDNHRWNFLIEQSINFDRSKVCYINHVDAHAASAYFCSPFNSSAVLIAEGGTGIYQGKGCQLDILDRIGYQSDTYQNGKKLPKRRDHFVNSSFFFDKISSFLGYDIFGAGQTMALAGYMSQLDYIPLVDVDPDRFNDFIINHDRTIFGMKDIPVFKEKDSKQLISNPWVSLAHQAQTTLEDDIMHLTKLAQEKTGEKNLCLAGGAALNCIANRKIIESELFENIFILPASSDEGIALGCALSGYYSNGGTYRYKMDNAYLGPENRLADLEKLLKTWKLKASHQPNFYIAQLLAEGKIIGRVAGRSEYGPRALGNRSILADPRSSSMKDRLNTKIKHRELFRPFAPSCLEDKIPKYFQLAMKSPFMLVAGSVKPNGQEKVPAIMHVDGTCRVQTVNSNQNSAYYDLIKTFGDLTGCPVLTNTSFTDRDEPIVETYDDAVKCFLRTELDAIYCDGLLVERTDRTPLIDRKTHEKNTLKNVNKKYINLIHRFCDQERYVKLANDLI